VTRFLVDAHLPLKLARAMSAAGYDTTHTRDLPKANATKDSEINALSIAEERVVVTKDADFVQSFTLQGRPYKLLLVSTGNIRNTELFELMTNRLEQLADLFEIYSYVELTRDALIIHV
jgi:predicted nuclease of predicted toxin-antitoxin system